MTLMIRTHIQFPILIEYKQDKQMPNTLTGIAIVCMLIACINTDQNVPIPTVPYGFTARQDQGYKLHLQFHIDLLCTDSQDLYFVLKEVLNTPGIKIKFTYQFSPLTWHFWTFKMQQAFFFILKNAGKEAAKNFIDYIMTNQQDYTQENLRNLALSVVSDNLAKQFAVKFKVNYQGLRQSLEFGSQQFTSARYHWKYGTGVRHIEGTPIFYGNGVRIDGADQWDANKWIQFIRKYQ